jgi:hypothetical protein
VPNQPSFSIYFIAFQRVNLVRQAFSSIILKPRRARPSQGFEAMALETLYGDGHQAGGRWIFWPVG